MHAAVDAAYDDPAVREPLDAFVARITPYGWTNSLGQKLVQLTQPGVPDVYQGTELWEDSLVDPDNRRPVDYEARRSLLDALDAADDAPPIGAGRRGEAVGASRGRCGCAATGRTCSPGTRRCSPTARPTTTASRSTAAA